MSPNPSTAVPSLPQVQSYLENPTSYHLQQSQHQKVREYLSETYGNKFAAHISPAQGSPKPPPAASPGVRAGHVLSTSAGNSAPNSPMAMLHISSNPEKEVSEGCGSAWCLSAVALWESVVLVELCLQGAPGRGRHSPASREPCSEESCHLLVSSGIGQTQRKARRSRSPG